MPPMQWLLTRIFNLKQRPEAKIMIILLADESELMQYVAHIDLQVFDYLARSKSPQRSFMRRHRLSR